MESSGMNVMYVLYDRNIPVFHHDNFNFVLYNMLSTISKYLSFLTMNNIHGVTISKTDMVIKMFLKDNPYYPLVNGDVFYDCQKRCVSAGDKKMVPVVEEYNDKLLENIKEQVELIENSHLPFKQESPSGTKCIDPLLKKTRVPPVFRSISKKDQETGTKHISSDLLTENISDEEICNMIKILEKKHSECVDEINKFKNETNQLVEYQSCINEIKMLENIFKDREEQRKREFDSSFKIYKNMKKVENMNVSELFKNKYEVFRIMDVLGDLEEDNDSYDGIGYEDDSNDSDNSSYTDDSDNGGHNNYLDKDEKHVYNIYRYVYDSLYSEDEVDDEYAEYFEKFVENKEKYMAFINEKKYENNERVELN